MGDNASSDTGPSERERALAARVSELEALVKARREGRTAGNLIEQAWRYFSTFVPPPIIAAGVAVFVLFQAWDFYIEGQMTAAETDFKQAQASLEDAKAAAQATIVNGEPLTVQTLTTQVAKMQAEAARAKIEADALTSTVDGETAALRKVQAEVERQQAAAAKAKQDAEAVTARFGLQTLIDREAFVQFVKSELDKMVARHDRAAQVADANDSSLLAGYAERTYPMVIDAECQDNALAKYVGCPERYIRRESPAALPSPSTRAVEATTEAIAPSFDCSKARYADEETICATPELARLDKLLDRAFAEVRTIPSSRQAALAASGTMLKQRHRCQSDVACIEETQRQELDDFRALGSTVSY